MDAEVIVLDDSSSDTPSEEEMAPASASTTPAASPAQLRRRAQSIGYANAVEAALAMAAALETNELGKKKKDKTQKRATPAPPLLSTKAKKPHAVQRQPGPKPVEKQRRTMANTPARRNKNEIPRSSDSDSSSSSRSGSRRVRVKRRPNGNAPATNAKRPPERKRRPDGDKRKKDVARTQIPTKSQKSVDVVNLMSSSSSSDSDTGCHLRSLSMSSVSSLTSSDGESLPPARSKTGKKRLVLNDRVVGTTASRPGLSSGQQTSNTAPNRPQFKSRDNKRTTGPTLVAPPGGKRKRVLPQMTRRENAGGGMDQDRVRKESVTKRTEKHSKGGVNSAQRRNPTSKPVTGTQSVPLAISLSSSSSSSSSSSPDPSPRPVPARKSAATLSALNAAGGRLQAGERDAFGRYRCHKTAIASTVSLVNKASVSASPTRRTSAESQRSPLPSPSPRKKRRVTAPSFFDADRVALNDIQAQERELAWIKSQRKQTQASPKSTTQKSKKCPDVISVDDQSDTNSTACSEEAVQNDGPTRVKIKVKPSSTAVKASLGDFFHPTSYRGIYLNEAPSNILPMGGQTACVPFDSRCDHPLTFYDETGTLESQCSILESFGKPTQCISSVFLSEAARPQTDITRSVSALVAAHLPIIRSCHRRKVQAILAETRQNISAYRTALMNHTRAMLRDHVKSRVYPRSATEKRAVKLLEISKHTCYVNAGSVSFQIGRGDGYVREKLVSSLIQVNRIGDVRPLRKYTVSVGVRANYRVDDDPILRYTAITRPTNGHESNDVEKKYALRIGNVADEEVIEYVLRLVVGCLGDSEQVFQALKSELDFSQAYTAYSELKKQHDSRQRASARLDRIEEISGDEARAADPGVAAMVNLMQQASLLRSIRAKVLSHRLQPPIGHFGSNIVDNLVDGATASMAALDLRATDSYDELADVYCSSFCRMCYRYACHEHGGDHPLPARRVDPAYPRVQQIVSPAAQAPAARVVEAGAMDVLDDDVVYRSRQVDGEKEEDADAGVSDDVEMGDDNAPQQQQQERKSLADPSEYIDGSHLAMVTTKMQSFLSKSSICSELCWKNGAVMGNVCREALSEAELGVVRKLRETMGDNSCLLAAVVGSASCIELHELIKNEKAKTMADGGGRSGRRLRNWKQGRRSGGSNHELLQRTRNQRLQDRGTENHEYKPCMHEGMCDSTGCSCMKRDHMCEKACACSRDCPNRFEGCTCQVGECRTSKCPCYAALRECDPDVCLSCGASELAVGVVNGTVANGVHAQSTCGNVNVIRSKHKRLGMSFSSIHGYGMYAREAISADEFVYEYTGAMLTQDEAERRGLIYDKMEMSYLFDLNEDAVLDALRSGNKSKFINHDGEAPNCTAKVVSVCGVHHISIWALRDIVVGEELVFDYGYKRSVGPDWSQRRAASKDTS